MQVNYLFVIGVIIVLFAFLFGDRKQRPKPREVPDICIELVFDDGDKLEAYIDKSTLMKLQKKHRLGVEFQTTLGIKKE